MSNKITVDQEIFEIEEIAPFELTPEQEAEAQRQFAIAEAEDIEVRVNFRWQKKSLEVIKRAANKSGVGYQAYLKMVAYKQALLDLQLEEQVQASS